MFQRILIATDGSTLSRKAVASGIALAAQHGADLVALTVVPRYPKAYFDGAMVFAPDDIARIEKQWAVAAEETLAAVATRAKSSGVKVKTVTVSSDLVAESIVADAPPWPRLTVPFALIVAVRAASSTASIRRDPRYAAVVGPSLTLNVPS